MRNQTTAYFSFRQDGTNFVLSDRMKMNRNEILIFPFPFLIFMFLITNEIIASVIIALFATLMYIVFRFTAWIYYNELNFDIETGRLTKSTHLLNSVRKINLITDRLDFDRFEFLEQTRSGTTKYLLTYKTHRNNDLLVIRASKDKKEIEDYLKEKITGYNKK